MSGLTIEMLVNNFGPMGVFIGYLIWREVRRDKADAARSQADVSLAVSLAALNETVKELRK